MKKILMLQLILSCLSRPVIAQFTSGNQFFISGKTTVSIHGLAVRPTFNNTIWSGKILTKSSEPIVGEPTSSINRVYTFNEPVAFTGMVGITYEPSELNGNTEAGLQMAYFNPDESYRTTTGSSVDQNTHFVSRNFTGLNNSFLRITAVDAASTLPVTLVSFNGIREGDQALLSWTTSSELNSDYFEVQYSRNGKVWRPLAKVDAAGTDPNGRTYTFKDEKPFSGTNLYRLKMVDKDETYAYSRIAELTFDNENALSAYPNPAYETLTLKGMDWGKTELVEFVNEAGQKVQVRETDHDSTGDAKSYNLKNVPSGMYIIKALQRDGTSQTTRVFKR